MEYTKDVTSPEIFRRWGAIAAISAALERKVWIVSQGYELYPNLYALLVGPPGIGKSNVFRVVESVITPLKDLHLAPSSVTSASLVDTMLAAKRSIVNMGRLSKPLEYNSLVAFASEFGVFMPMYEPTIINGLQKFYDGERYTEARRTKDLRITIDKPLLSLFGGTTPSYLSGTLPEGAWDQGFISRTIMVYSAEQIIRDPFAPISRSSAKEDLFQDLVEDIKSIHALVGEFTVSPEAVDFITEWNRAGLSPVPIHMKLQHYNTRRLVHTIKLSMIACVMRTNSMNVDLEDFQTAQSWLLEAEELMPDIFKSVGLGGDSRAIEETWYFVYEAFTKEHRPIKEHRIINFVRERVAAHSVMRVIELMVKSKMLLMVGPDDYQPAPKVTHH